MLNFELHGGRAAADTLLAAVQLGVDAPRLGGPETLLTLPARSSHVGLAPELRRALGIGDGLVRMSVGLEDAEDLIDDLQRGLDSRVAVPDLG